MLNCPFQLSLDLSEQYLGYVFPNVPAHAVQIGVIKLFLLYCKLLTIPMVLQGVLLLQLQCLTRLIKITNKKEVFCVFPETADLSLVQAAGNPTVNLLILDIEGAELAVLKTIPWEKVDIQVNKGQEGG